MEWMTGVLQFNGQVFQKVVGLSLSAVILVIAILLIKRLAGSRLSPQWHYMLWFLLIFKLIMPLEIPSSLSIENIPRWWQSQENQQIQLEEMEQGQEQPKPADPLSPPIVSQTVTEEENLRTIIPNDVESVNQENPLTSWQLAGLLWSLGMLGVIAYYCFAYRRIYREIKKGSLPVDPALRLMLEDCLQESSVKQPVELKWVCSFQQPFVVGIFKPLVVLPLQTMNGLTEGEQRNIIRHELMHLKGGDHVTRSLMLAVQAIHWFNPVVWLAFRKMTQDCELVCDARVVSSYSDQGRNEYAQTLIEMATKQKQQAQPSVLYFGENGFKNRIVNVLQYKRYSVAATLTALGLVVLIGVIFLTGSNANQGKITNDALEQLVPEQFVLEEQDLEQLDEIGQDIEALIDAMLEEAPAASSNPYDYINSSTALEELVSLGNPAMYYMVDQFQIVNEDGLREYIMAVACSKIWGVYDETRGMGTTSGREWFYKYIDVIKQPESITEIDADWALFEANSTDNKEFVLHDSVDQSNLDEVLSYYLRSQLRKRHMMGEKDIEVHKVFRMEEDGDRITVYLEVAVAWYRFEDKIFTGFSGGPALPKTLPVGQWDTGALPMVVELEKTAEGYEVLGHQERMDGGMWVESLQEMLPADIVEQMVAEAAITSHELQQEMLRQAKLYLQSIGRSEAQVTNQIVRVRADLYQSEEERKALQLVTAVQNDFLEWEGSVERLYRVGGPAPGANIRAVLTTSIIPLGDEIYEVTLTKEWDLTRGGKPVVSYWQYRVSGDRMELVESQNHDPSVGAIK